MFILPRDEYCDWFEKMGIILQWTGSLIALGNFFLDKEIQLKIFIIGALLFLVGLLFEIAHRSNILFWLKVKNHPDLAYAWFKRNKAWRVIEGKLPENYKRQFPKDEWVGPFHLCVPFLNGEIINIFAVDKAYRQTIADFLREVQSIEN